MSKQAVVDFVNSYKSPSALAILLDTPSANIKMAMDVGHFPKDLCAKIEKLTDGKVTAADVGYDNTNAVLEYQLNRVLQRFGNSNRLAIALGISRAATSRWVATKKIGRSGAQMLHEFTGGELNKEDLRPDINWS